MVECNDRCNGHYTQLLIGNFRIDHQGIFMKQNPESEPPIFTFL